MAEDPTIRQVHAAWQPRKWPARNGRWRVALGPITTAAPRLEAALDRALHEAARQGLVLGHPCVLHCDVWQGEGEAMRLYRQVHDQAMRRNWYGPVLIRKEAT